MTSLKSVVHIERFVQGTIHQGLDVFCNSSRGRQCVANALISCVVGHISEKPLVDWTSSDINNILHEGDALYHHVRKLCSSVHLDPFELEPCTKILPGIRLEFRRFTP